MTNPIFKKCTTIVPNFTLQLMTILTFWVTEIHAQLCVESPTGIVSWWAFDEFGGTTAEDRVGNHIGAYSNNPQSSEGMVARALHFDGNDYVAVADNDLWAFGTDDFTIELWANFDHNGGGSIGQPGDIFIGNDEGPGTRNKWFFALGGGYLNFHINGPSTGSRFFPTASFSPIPGQWYHLAITRNGSLFTIYINGQPAASATETRTIPNANAPLTIGQAENLGFMNGRIDEISIYKRALTQVELQSIYDAGSAGKCKELEEIYPEPVTELCFSLQSGSIISVYQNTVITKELTLKNISSTSELCTLEIINPNSDIDVNITGTSIYSFSPGESHTIPIEINTASSSTGVHQIMLKTRSSACGTVISNIPINIFSEASIPHPDLSISVSGINFTNYTLDGPSTIDISINNNGTATATDVPIAVYRFNNLLTSTTISSISPEESQTVQLAIPKLTSGEHLFNVIVDEDNTIDEIDKTNNEASRILKIGDQTIQPGGILVIATLPKTVYTDDMFTISGRTMYDVIVDGVRYTNYLVKGCAITLTISDNAGHSWVYNGGHSTISGDYSIIVHAPSTPGVYTATIAATDQTFSGSRTVSFTVLARPEVLPPPPQPPLPPYVWSTGASGNWIWYPGSGGGGTSNGYWGWTWDVPPSIPVPQQDISVYSENIHFSKNNPAQGEEMTIFTEFNYWSTSTTLDALNVPVNIYVTRPGSEKVKIGSAVIGKISVSAPENGSRFVYVNWKNEQDGIYIVEAEVDPSYIEANMKNNAATRAIIVGEYTPNQGILSGQVTGPEGGMKDIGIELYDDYGMLRYTTTTDNGFYLIDALQVGTYTVKCVVPVGYASDTVSRIVEIVDQQVTTADFTLYISKVLPVPDIDPLPVLSGECSVNATAVPTAKDHSGNIINGTTDDPVSYTELGEYIINWHFTDVYGSTTTQSQLVIVKDNTPPEVEVLPVLTGECSVAITTPPTAVDNCAGTITGTTTSSLPLVFNQQGTFSVIWTFSDGHGNSAVQTQTVVVADHTAPMPDVATLPVITGQCGVDVTVVPVATDNCAGVLTAVTTDPLSYSIQGTFTITWTFNDGHGNSATQVQTVIVNDDVAPVPDLSNLPDITGTGNVTVTGIPTATDNCIGSVNGSTSNPLTYNQPGTYTITWNYSDGHGNNSSQQQNVIVIPDVPVERCISNLAARAKQDKIQLTWTDNGSSVYHVFRSDESATSGFSEIATTSSTYSTYLDNGLTVGKTYWYKVTGDGICSNSEVVSAVPQSRTTRTR